MGEDLENDKAQVAIALRYDPDDGTLPEVAAKGHGLMAEQIIKMAKDQKIPIKKDPNLAAILEKLQPGSPIPVAAFAAVASILAALYRANAELEAASRPAHAGGYQADTGDE